MKRNVVVYNSIPLLITGCIAPSPNQEWLKLVDEKERLRQYVDSISFYIKNQVFSKIVFCENSGYNFDGFDELEKSAKINGKEIEWLSFKGDFSKVEKNGKSAGEDEIINYALNYSKILNSCRSFAKTTGRLKIKNIDEICKNVNLGNNYFYRDIYRTHCHGVDTRFYICDKEFFNKVLRNCYEGKEYIGETSLEDIYYPLLKNNFLCFSGYFNVMGVSGGNGKNYSNESTLRLRVFNIFCVLGIYNKCFPFLHFSRRVIRKLKRIFFK